jgi:hypothetical protein
MCKPRNGLPCDFPTGYVLNGVQEVAGSNPVAPTFAKLAVIVSYGKALSLSSQQEYIPGRFWAGVRANPASEDSVSAQYMWLRKRVCSYSPCSTTFWQRKRYPAPSSRQRRLPRI